MKTDSVSHIIETGDLFLIETLYTYNKQYLNADQKHLIERILNHVEPKENSLKNTLKLVSGFLIAYGLAFIVVSLLTGCADTDIVNVDREPDIINNTYLTEITQIIREEVPGATIVAYVYPCGSGNHKEALLKLSNGDLLAVFDSDTSSDLQQTRLVKMVNGSYMSTHGAGDCNFTVLDGTVTPSTIILL